MTDSADAIIRALAAHEPLGSKDCTNECVFCGCWGDEEYPVRQHEEDCPWRMASEYVAARVES